MRKSQQQRQGLVKLKNKTLNQQDLKGRAAPEGEFRIIGVHQLNKSVWIEDTVNTFAKAKQLVDNFQTADVIYYVHNDSNRIIYDSKKE